MKINHFDNPQLFYQQAKNYLLRYEAEHNLLLGISQTLIHSPERYGSEPYLATVEEEGKILAVAMRTPPYNFLLSKIENFAAIEVIAQDLYEKQISLPGVSGLTAETETFAQKWHSLTHQAYEIEMHLRIHQLKQVEAISKVNGFLRLATENDRALLFNWYEQFIQEAAPSEPTSIEKTVDYHLSQNHIYLWQNEVPVSMASATEATQNSSRIGPVYTPPEYRKKGYASACVATLSQQLLNQGYQACYLYTDLANPTSNHIYKTIGYQPVCDWNIYQFK
ncbi:MAG: GNAT family N-acetyltransferase [Limnoraphis robusta]|uniref:GCN5 family acetyltransferase n=1 Tax=Limnoraphis robusta CS-951 TaxID=1637645 RepID=A0A0F5YH09_9CYAN|nr:GNAT family N-acetyltransferase [Limnoraphis robusta]KKD37500.1 GCN5 family acetyltransferase [Limnoraphis robusta CS-951]